MDKKGTADIGQTDKRIIQRRILIGELSQESLQAYQKAIPDVSENAREVALPKEPRRKSAPPSGNADAD